MVESARTSKDVNYGTSVRHGFRFLNPDATVTVDLNTNTNDSSLAMFLELLFYT